MRRLLVFALLFPFPALAEPVYATTEADAVRWPDTTFKTLSVKKGDTLELILRDGDKVRVRKGTDFGWLPATDVTTDKPAPDPAPADATEEPAP